MAATDDLIRASLTDEGFEGFVTFDALPSGGINSVPTAGGVYVVLREAGTPPSFLASNPGGRFKRRDPTVAVAELEAKWVGGCHVIYIGKAKNLRRRVKQYMDFGLGKAVGHWGGRYIWQLVESDKLLVAWHPITWNEVAREYEKRLLSRFSVDHDGRRPFANLRG